MTGKRQGFINSPFLVSTNPPELIVCNSIFDALIFWGFGFKNVTANLSPDGLSKDLKNYLLNSQVKRIYVAYANTKTGNDAALQLQKDLSQISVPSYRIEFPVGQDANQFILKTKMPKEDLAALVQTASMIKEKAA